MLQEAGIETSERNVALLLHDAQGGHTQRESRHAPALDIARLVDNLLEEQEAQPVRRGRSQFLPHHRAHAPDLPFEVPKRVRMAFDAVDADKSGYLENDEIMQALRRFGIDATSPTGRELVYKACGSDGKLDFNEFATLVVELEEKQRTARQLQHFSCVVTPRAADSPRFLYPRNL